MLAAYRVPAAAKAAWGCMAEDLDDTTWELLGDAEPEPPQSAKTGMGEAGVGLGMLLKMTRLHDLGLAQLCVPELVTDESVTYENLCCTQKQQDQNNREGEAVTCT
jgi:hypothetical protein